jgi:hypothetical protein
MAGFVHQQKLETTAYHDTLTGSHNELPSIEFSRRKKNFGFPQKSIFSSFNLSEI